MVKVFFEGFIEIDSSDKNALGNAVDVITNSLKNNNDIKDYGATILGLIGDEVLLSTTRGDSPVDIRIYKKSLEVFELENNIREILNELEELRGLIK